MEIGETNYLVVAGEPSVKSRKAKLASKDCNRHHSTAWYEFGDDLDEANAYADDLMRRHPGWTVAVVNLGLRCGKPKQ